MQIRENAFGTVVSDRFTSDRGSEKFVEATISSESTINIAATGDLNRAGVAALKRILAVAEAIVESGGLDIE